MKDISQERFGYHVVYDADICDAINFALQHGFGYIVPDLMIPRFFPDHFSKSERHRIRDFANSKGVSISFHGPSDYVNLGTLYPEVRRAVLDRMKLCLDFARDVEAERFTIHIDPPYDFVLAGRKGTYLRDHWAMYKDTARESLVQLVEYSNEEVLICVENDRFTEISMELLEELLPTTNLFLSWDIPKSHTDSGKPVPQIEDFLLRHLGKVRECHLHDQKLGKPSHDILGVGKIDFPRYLKLLLPKNVHFTLEIRPRRDALKSLKILNNMCQSIGYQISTMK
jgi:sugar phosphate isomerase/epimerase